MVMQARVIDTRNSLRETYICKNIKGSISSVGRAFGLHPKCRRFEPVIDYHNKCSRSIKSDAPDL